MMAVFLALKEKTLKSGPSLTILDALKLFGVLAMTADHTGYFFFPDNLWWRVAGHAGPPSFWFFLLGFSRKRTIDRLLIIYAAIMFVQFFLLGMPLLPLNIFISFIACRLWVNFCEDKGWFEQPVAILLIAALSLPLMLPIDHWLVQYGTAGLLYAMLGHQVRAKRTTGVYVLALAASACVFLSYFYWWQLSLLQGVILVTTTLLLSLFLVHLRNDVLIKDWTKSWAMTGVAILCRNTIHYFYFHLLFLNILWLALRHH